MLSAPASWLLLAAALLMAGDRTDRRGRHGHPAGRRTGRQLPPRALAAGSALAVAVASVVVAGPVAGLVAAAVLAPIAAASTSRLAARPVMRRPDASLALALDLAAAALRSGQSVPTALSLTAPILPDQLAGQWRRTAALLALGADPVQAWAVLGEDAALAPVAMAARRSADSGARLARTLAQLAADTRAGVRAEALARANRAGVFAMAPLGLCFLPAFICLGIVPTVVGVAQGVLPGLR